jgi:hypothetical protein
MIGRMILHGVAAAVVVGALAFGWQIFASGEGADEASGLVAGAFGGDGHGRGHDARDD